MSRVVLLSGAPSDGSRVERIAAWCARHCRGSGAEAEVFTGADLDFPCFRPDRPDRDARQRRYLAAMADCDGVVLLSPAYHGTLSGLLKNALDYVNDLAGGDRPFLDGRAVGCVAVSAGGQAATTTLATLRVVAHALRGWPTPMGVALAGPRADLDADGRPGDPVSRDRLRLMLDQVLDLAEFSRGRRSRTAGLPAPAGSAGA